MGRIHTLTKGPLDHVARHMRYVDRAEFAACRENLQLEDLAAELWPRTELGYMAHADDGEPVAAIGAVRMWPGACAMWAFGTDRWPEVILSLTKHTLRVMVPELLGAGFHYAEARALASRSDVDKWLGLLGFEQKCRLTGFGSGREDFILYAWTASEHRDTQRL